MEFKDYLQNEFDLSIDNEALEKFNIYYEVLVEWNKKMNLTGITERNEVYLKHFIDSISLIKGIDITNQKILDVGSGAGFPSIPLKILFPDLKVTIIDSLKKRIDFLSHLVNMLGLTDVELIHGRVEEHDRKNYYDIVTARAVAKLNILTELCSPFVKKRGVYIAMKGARFQEEIDANINAAKLLNLESPKIFNYNLNGDKRVLLVYEKIKESANKYPRSFSKIKNKPL